MLVRHNRDIERHSWHLLWRQVSQFYSCLFAYQLQRVHFTR